MLKKIIATLTAALMVCQTIPVNAQVSNYNSTSDTSMLYSTNDFTGFTEISSVTDLQKLRSNPGGNYVLTSDIDLSEATSEGGEWDNGNGWEPIAEFSGILDGNGYRIKGMNIYGDVITNIGFIKKLSGTIRNLGLTDIAININADCVDDDCEAYDVQIAVGGLAAASSKDSNISMCYVTGSIKIISSSDPSVGGIAGDNFGKIENCINLTNIDVSAAYDPYGNLNISGICGCGYDGCIVENCYNAGKILAYDELGNPITDSYEYNPNNCYYLLGSGEDERKSSKALTSAQMEIQQSFVGFDFDNVWEIDVNGTYKYPQLRSARIDRVSGFELVNAPAKTTYNQGDTLTLFGGTVKITYEDSTAAPTEVFLTDSMIDKTSYDMSKIGVQDVRIRFGGFESSFKIDVKAIPVTEVKFQSPSISLNKGNSKTVVATIVPDNATYGTLTYESADPNVATVDKNSGKITAISKGTTTITATSGDGVSAICNVTVNVPATNIVLDKSSLEMYKGEKAQLTAVISPLDSDDTVVWSSSDSRIASVDSKGNIVANGAGKVTITAKANNSISKNCTVTVIQNIDDFVCTGISDKFYTGNKIEQDIQISDGTKVLRKNIDYTVAYSDNVEEGTASIVIEGKGYYDGSIIKSFEIKKHIYSVTFISNGKTVKKQQIKEGGNATAPTVKKKGYIFKKWSQSVSNVKNNISTIAIWEKVSVATSSITSAKDVGKNKATVKFKKISNAAGYKVRYSLKSNMSNAKVKNCKNTTVTLDKLTSGKTYYIQVQAYKKDSTGAKVYGKWSKTKKLKIAKVYHKQPTGSYTLNVCTCLLKSMQIKNGKLTMTGDKSIYGYAFDVGKKHVPLDVSKIKYSVSKNCKWYTGDVYAFDNIYYTSTTFKQVRSLALQDRKNYIKGGDVSPYYMVLEIKNNKVVKGIFFRNCY